MKPKRAEGLTTSQKDQLMENLGLEAADIKEAFKFYFPQAAWILEEGLGRQDLNRAVVLDVGFKAGYLAAKAIEFYGPDEWASYVEDLAP